MVGLFQISHRDPLGVRQQSREFLEQLLSQQLVLLFRQHKEIGTVQDRRLKGSPVAVDKIQIQSRQFVPAARIDSLLQ